MIKAGDEVIPLKFEYALFYSHIQTQTQWELNIAHRVMLTSNEPWDTF